MYKKNPSIALLCATLFVPIALPAQQATTAPVTIRVSDPTGADVAHAQIRFVPSPEEAPPKLETDNHGQLSIHLKAGAYALFVSAPGFKTAAQHIDIGAPENEGRAGQTIPVVLQMGDVSSPTPIYPRDSLVLTADPDRAPAALSPADFRALHTLPSPCTIAIPILRKPTPAFCSPPCWKRSTRPSAKNFAEKR